MIEPIVIAGGGPVGMCLALRLVNAGLPVEVIEAKSAGAYYHDDRALALSQASRLILQRLGVWSELQQHTEIAAIHISQKGSLGRSRLRASDYDMPALGYVLSYGHLMQALDRVIAKHHAEAGNGASSDYLRIRYDTQVSQIVPQSDSARLQLQQHEHSTEIHTALAVVADGGRSLSIPGLHRVSKAYGHHALVSKVRAEVAHQNVAYERFTSQGPVALLPNGPEDFSLVWTGPSEAIEALAQLDEATFLTQLHLHFGDRVGRFTQVQKRLCFPLQLSYLDPVTAPHLVVIGNAAQTMHPVAGQGFNIGLRDAWQLAEQIIQAAPLSLGDGPFLQAYQQRRQHDTTMGIQFTDWLVRGFSNDVMGFSLMRSLGLALFDSVRPAKQRLIEKMSFGA